MNFLFSFFVFMAFACGISSFGIMYYRQSVINKLKGVKGGSVAEKIKYAIILARKKIKNVNIYFIKNKFYDEIRRYLALLNLEDRIDEEGFLFIQEIFAVFFLIFSLVVFNSWFFALVLCFLGFYLPVIILKVKVKNKQQQILRELPDGMDIIAANIESGLSVNQAISRYAGKNNNLFSVELQIVMKKVQLGQSFEEALRELDEKLNIKEISSFVNSFIQAEKIGGNIKKIIKDQAEEIRKKRFQFLKKKAYEAPVKLLIPLILFIFPVIFIVLFGPIIIKLLNGF